MIRLLLFLLVFSEPFLLSEPSFAPFTAKVSKRKVRLRTRPELEAPIVRELVPGDMVIVDGEEGLFYQIKPPIDTKLYLFRTFVLDGMVEGNRVNVRLAPDLEAPIIAQLNTGDSVSGAISSLHPKWMEISPPEKVRFFIAKDFVENVGDVNYLSLHLQKSQEVKDLLALGHQKKGELQKPFEMISLEGLLAPFQEVKSKYKEFEQEVAIAEEAIRELNQEYLLKKVAYLEEKACHHSSSFFEPVTTLQTQEELEPVENLELAFPTLPPPHS